MPTEGWLRPLVARFPNRADVEDIVAPAYDSLSPVERYRYAMDHPRSFMNVVLSRNDFPPPPRSAEEVAERARTHLVAMVERGDYGELHEPALYVYRMAQEDRTQTGVVAGLSIDLVRDHHIRGHEAIIAERSADIATFFATTGVNASPVSLAAVVPEGFGVRLDAATHDEPVVDYRAEDGVTHQLWPLTNPAVIEELDSMVATAGVLYVTDGHHRVSASMVDADRMGGGTDSSLLGVIFPADEVQVLAYNRAVRLSPGFGDIQWHAIADRYEIRDAGAVGDDVVTDHGTFLVLAAGRWTRLVRRAQRPTDPVEALDVSLLHREVLPVLGVDSDDDPRLRYVIGKGGPARMALECEEDDVGFVMHEPAITELVAVADTARAMPAKSTYFYPKVRSGLVYVTRARP